MKYTELTSASSYTTPRPNVIAYNDDEVVSIVSAASSKSSTRNMTFTVGENIHITKGKYAGKSGSIMKVTPEKVQIQTSDGVKTGHIPKTSVVKDRSSGSSSSSNSSNSRRSHGKSGRSNVNFIPDDDGISFLTSTSLPRMSKSVKSSGVVSERLSHHTTANSNANTVRVPYNDAALVSEASTGNDAFEVGEKIYITKGKYGGQRSTITKITPLKLKVKTSEGVDTGHIPKTSVVKDDESSKRVQTTNLIPNERSFSTTISIPRSVKSSGGVSERLLHHTSTTTTSNNTLRVAYNDPELVVAFKAGDDVFITKGKYGGKRGTITKVTPQKLKVKTSEGVETGHIPKTSVVLISTILSSYTNQ